MAEESGSPVLVSSPISKDGATVVLDIGNNLGTDGNGAIYIPSGSVSATEIAANAVGTSEADYAAPVSGDGNGALTIALGNALTTDANGNLAVSEGGISHDNIGGVSRQDHRTDAQVKEQALALDFIGI